MDEEELIKDFIRLKAEYSVTKRNEIVIKLLPVIERIAKKFAKTKEKDSDDYISVANLAAVVGLDMCVNLPITDKIKSYIFSRIYKQMASWYWKDSIVVKDVRTMQRCFQRGNMEDLKRGYKLNDLEGRAERNPVLTNSIVVEDELDLDLDCLNDYQKRIVTLRLDNHNLGDICLLLSISRKDLNEHLKAIKGQLCES